MDAEARHLRQRGKRLREIAVSLGVSETLVGCKLRQKAPAKGTAGAFSVGDRVIYHANVYGNADIDGWIGEVIYVDGTHCPYTVRFEQSWVGGMTEERLSDTRESFMRCWFCREENLSPVEETKKQTQPHSGVK
jgi:hypothetical protein